VKYEEMFVVWKHASQLLTEAGLTIVRLVAVGPPPTRLPSLTS
jgi:hypothetical protein